MTGSGLERREHALHDVIVAASSLLDPSRLAAVSTAQVRRVLEVDGATLTFWDPDLGVLVPLAFDDPRVDEPEPVFHPGQGLIGEAFARDAPVLANDYRRHLGNPPPWAEVRSGIGVPLRADGRLLGALSAQHYEPREFTGEDVELLELIAAQVGPALGTMRTLARAQLRTAQAYALARLMRRGTELRDEEALFRLICDAVVRLLGADLAGIVVRATGGRPSGWHGVVGNHSDDWRHLRYGLGHPAAPTIFGDEIRVVDGGGAVIDGDSFPFFHAEGVRVGVALPLEAIGPARGALCLGWRFPVELADAQLEFAEAIARYTGTLVLAAAARAERDALIGHAPVMLAAVDVDGILTLCEGAGARAIGLGPGDLGRHLGELLADEPAALTQLRAAWRDAPPSRLLLGLRGRGFDATIVAHDEGAFLVATDITERLAAERELARRASEDELTGLPNEPETVRRVGLALQTGPLSLALADIRSFDLVNEAIGYDSANELLSALGARLVLDFPDAAVVGRIGGDEFVVATRDPDPMALGALVRASLEAFVSHGTEEAIAVDVRCGVAAMAAGGDARRLLRNADSALQIARRGHGALAPWDAEVAGHRRGQLSLSGELRRALAAGAFTVDYQPVVGVTSGEVRFVEALARWQTPSGEPVSPSVFVPLAERLGRIGQLTAHVLDRALVEAAVGAGVAVSVNVSAIDVMHGDLPALVADRLAARGVAPELLTLELTETAALEAGVSELEKLVRLGVTLAVDDFGRGWSSLGLLKRLPARRLKLDRSFVALATRDATDQAIIRAAAALGHAFGLEVVAEGVEDASALETVGRLGCDLAQGFHLARPMNITDLGEWLARPA